MPIYLYQNIETEEIKEVYQSVHDKHEYSENGIKFQRVFTIPNASSNTQINPFSSKEFVSKLDNKKGETIGSTMDRAAELSAKRAEKNGKDPIKEKYYKDFSKRHKGLQHPTQVKENCAPTIKKLADLGIKVNF